MGELFSRVPDREDQFLIVCNVLDTKKDEAALHWGTLWACHLCFSPGKQASSQQEEGIGHVFQEQIFCSS